MVLKVDPEVIDTEVTNIKSLAEQFGIDLDSRQSAIEGLDWDGQTREAFIAMFESARTQFRDVEAQIDGIAEALKGAKDGLIDADTSIAQGISG